MTTKGIIFSGAMVRALLDGRKTQTRRLCAPANAAALTFVVPLALPGWFGDEEGDIQFRAAYAPGDRLYVRECWGMNHYEYERGKAPTTRPPDLEDQYLSYRATEDDCEIRNELYYRPSIHMPRWASRLWLSVSAVRVERVQEMEGQHPLESDAVAEGINRIHHGDGEYYYSAFRDRPHPKNWCDPADAFRELWDSLHTKPDTTWADNPWVVAVTFDVHDGNID